MSTYTLEVTDEQWEQVGQRDPSMLGQRMKEWPYFPDWLEIFGKKIPVAATEMRDKYTQPSVDAAFGADSNFNEVDYVNLDDDSNPKFRGEQYSVKIEKPNLTEQKFKFGSVTENFGSVLVIDF